MNKIEPVYFCERISGHATTSKVAEAICTFPSVFSMASRMALNNKFFVKRRLRLKHLGSMCKSISTLEKPAGGGLFLERLATAKVLNCRKKSEKMSKQAIQLTEIFKQLPLVEKLNLIELFFRNIREETMKKVNDEEEMRKAAKLLLTEYQHNEELTAFTILDHEDFHETR